MKKQAILKKPKTKPTNKKTPFPEISLQLLNSRGSYCFHCTFVFLGLRMKYDICTILWHTSYGD